MAGYWPSSFWVFMDWNRVEVHKLAKKDQGQYPAILIENARSLKDTVYYYVSGEYFVCVTRQISPKMAKLLYLQLPARVSNHRAQFGPSSPLIDLAM